jgi:hypothetical protein
MRSGKAEDGMNKQGIDKIGDLMIGGSSGSDICEC